MRLVVKDFGGGDGLRYISDKAGTGVEDADE